jgi:flagellar biogenesis protein FliO
MPFTSRCLGVVLFLYAFLHTVGLALAGETPEAAPPPSISAADPYRKAIEQAEEELGRLNTGADGGGGWSTADLLALMAFIAALALMVWAARWARGFSPFRGPKGREMALLDRMAIGRQSTLLVVRLRGRDYWIADHANGVTMLAELPPPGDTGGERAPDAPDASPPAVAHED